MPTHAEKIALAKKMRDEPTPSEATVWKFLQKHPWTWVRQEVIWGWIVDFYCPEERIVLEVDGTSHREPAAVQADLTRDWAMYDKGLWVLRFPVECLEITGWEEALKMAMLSVAFNVEMATQQPFVEVIAPPSLLVPGGPILMRRRSGGFSTFGEWYASIPVLD